MSSPREREIARKLAEREDFEPPAGLLDKIKSEIPPEVTLGTGAAEERRSGMPSHQRWLIAASLIAMLGAGLFALRLRQEAPALETAVAPRSAAEAPRRWSAVGPQRAGEAPAPQSAAASQPAVGRRESDASEPLRQLGEFALAPKDKERAQSRNEAAPSPASPPAEAAAAAPRLDRVDKLKADLKQLGYAQSTPAQPAKAEPKAIEGGVEGRVQGGVAGGVVGGVVGGTPGAVADSITVTAESPLLDERRISTTSATVTQAELEKLPTARMKAAGLRSEAGAAAAATFKSAGINGFVDTASDRLSTFGLDVDTASYTVARRYLTDGQLPDPKSVRVEEYVNFFDYGDASPARADFALKAEGAPTPFVQGPRYRLLRFNVKAREMRADNRRPVVLTFVIDVSGSMDQPNRLGLVKQSLALLLDQLRPTDRVGLVTFGNEARVLLEPTNDRDAVRQAIDRLQPEGSTNTEDGLLKGYEMAGRNFRANAWNRIILCSDGVANVGHAGPYAILGQIGRAARQGIELTTLGFGMGDYNDHLMEQLADRGDGRYAYIDTLDEAKRVLVEQLTGTLMTIAKDAKVQVDFNPAVVARYRLLGYENRAIADDRFRDNSVDAGEVGAGHGVTALYEIELRPDAPRNGLVAALHLRYRSPEIGNLAETKKEIFLSEFASAWTDASPGFRLAALVGQLAEILRQSPWTKGDLTDLSRQMRQAEGALAKGARTSELADLVEKAARIKAATPQQ